MVAHTGVWAAAVVIEAKTDNTLPSLGLQTEYCERMDAVGEDEPDPIKLKSIKNNKTFTVPQNDRVRQLIVERDENSTVI